MKGKIEKVGVTIFQLKTETPGDIIQASNGKYIGGA